MRFDGSSVPDPHCKFGSETLFRTYRHDINKKRLQTKFRTGNIGWPELSGGCGERPLELDLLQRSRGLPRGR
jgi:hypothetical protein